MTSNTIWVDVTRDFDPVDYAETFADDDTVAMMQEADSVESQLLCLYENGYLAKREGKMQYLLPEDVDLYEYSFTAAAEKKAKKAAAKPGMFKRMGAAIGGAAGKARARAGEIHKAGRTETVFGRGIVPRRETAKDYVKGAWGAMTQGEKRLAKGAAGVAGLTALGLGAHKLYKKAEARRKAKKKNEDLNELDLEFILDEAYNLGFEFDDIDDLEETLAFGEYVDDILIDADQAGLTEHYDEEDIIAAVLEEDDLEYLDEEEGRLEKIKAKAKDIKRSLGVRASQTALGKAHTRGRLFAAFTPGAGRAERAKKYIKGVWGAGKAGKAGIVGAGLAGVTGAALAGRALYKRMQRRKDARKARGESLNDFDLQRLMVDSQELGFEFEDYESLIEAMQVGEIIDAGFDYYLGDEAGLLENELDEESTLDILEAILDDVDDDVIEALVALDEMKGEQEHELKRMKRRLRRGAAIGGGVGATATGAGMYALGRHAGLSHKQSAAMAAKGAATGAVGGAAYGHGIGGIVHAVKERRKRKKAKKESLGENLVSYNGYRSTPQGSIYESAPIPVGTGNELYNRVSGLLRTPDGQTFTNRWA